MEKARLLLITIVLTLAILATNACDKSENGISNETPYTDGPGFGIYLADSRELVLSERHIKAYRRGFHLTVAEEDTHAIELNEEGIEKWNSYMTYETIPKLKDTLYKRDFVLKIEGEEIYRGKFYSMLSSSTYDGIAIIDALFELDDDRNEIWICSGYPPGLYPDPEQDPRNDLKVISFLENLGLLK
jgi:hypothetical protein